MERVNVLLRLEISRVLASKVKDPRLSALVSVTRVAASPDLKQARVYVSVLGDSGEKVRALRALRSASGFVRSCLRDQVILKSVPTVDFRMDDSIEQGSAILKLLNDVSVEPAGVEEP
jgi:ribosome-binding factor A